MSESSRTGMPVLDAVEETESSVLKHWWLPAVRGALAIVVGVLALYAPGASLAAVALVVAITFIVDGVLTLYRSFSGAMPTSTKLLGVFMGLLGIVAGVIAIARPLSLVLVLSWLLAIWLVVSGVLELVVGFSQRDGRWFRLILGVLSVIVGFSLLVHPVDAVATLAFVFGFTFLVIGITEIVSAFELRGAAKRRGLI